MNQELTLAVDIGGTKIAIAVIHKKGQIKDIIREKIDLSDGAQSLSNQILHLSLPWIKKYKIKKAAVACAGPLDPIKGILFNPTNLKVRGKFLGQLDLKTLLKKKLKIQVVIENDAAAAALGEYWMGAQKKTANMVVVTLGTGVGVGVIANKSLLRSGRNLHTEGGHIIINSMESQRLCGCGSYGCAEAYLSGPNFARNVNRLHSQKNLSTHEIMELARAGDKELQKHFQDYSIHLAAFLSSLSVLFSPEKIILSGGFSHAADLFLDSAKEKLKDYMKNKRLGIDLLPKIEVSKFQDEAGLLGAAYISFYRM